MFYSVSYTMTRNDNGHCNTFTDWEAAKAAFKELIRDGAIRVVLWSGDKEFAGFDRSLMPVYW